MSFAEAESNGEDVCTFTCTCPRLPLPALSRLFGTGLLIRPRSGIFGYVNYLVEKDRKVILQTLINGKPESYPAPRVGRDHAASDSRRRRSAPVRA